MQLFAISVRYVVILQELFQQPQNGQLSTNADLARSLPEPEVDTELSKLPRPDVMQMLPFKPKRLVRESCALHLQFCNSDGYENEHASLAV